MPGLNQRGPEGQGPMTGRRMGRCTNFGATAKKEDNDQAGDVKADKSENSRGGGLGFKGRMGGKGKGRGMGRQNRFRGGF